ncbi:divergent CRAL/TRIO domain-containing protein [Elsinoe australis]|uniref:Divergent CRAL/TRIO domain-containing protein n=1 Tax=Elsinoe australis TaxID=40998 RepID=A0A4U7AP12_9PEZI|nr:divergent CRAL/TRIO domain-containing protein [Elsinoe australis]
MKSAFVQRAARMRSGSSTANLQTVPPPESSEDYSNDYASIASSILYQSPLPSQSGLPVYILNAAAFPDSQEVDYDSLLPYVLARLPGEDDLIAGTEYEVVFFAGGQPESVTGEKKSGPGIAWFIQVYQVLGRALRKRLQKIYIVHERSWVRVLTEVFGTIVSPKFKKKVVHLNTLSALALYIPLETLLIPPPVYLHDRKLNPDIYVPYATGNRAFAANEPLPKDSDGRRRLPRVLREATSFLLQDSNLKIEGIFRIPPHSTLLGVVREAYDRGQHFIVWKEGAAASVDPRMSPQTLAEIHESDAYGVMLAAGLVKVWYRELKTPIIPERCYEDLRQSYGTPDVEITQEALVSLLSPHSKESFLPHISRLIIAWHLLPLLSNVTAYEKLNKMTPENLVVCFAPALICGSDQLQDAKMTTVIRRVFSEAVSQWPHGLSESCGTSQSEFLDALKPPSRAEDYEDPLPDMQRENAMALDERMQYISLRDGETPEIAPPLPPRSSSLPRGRDGQPAQSPLPKRKPAPTVSSLPRYSTLMSDPSAPPAYTNGQNMPTDSKQRMQDEQNGFLPEKTSRSQSAQAEQIAQVAAPLSTASVRRSATVTANVSTKPNGPPSPPLLSPSLADIQGAQTMLRSVSGDSTRSDRSDDGVFIKPTWAASSRQTSVSSAKSVTRKPSPPINVTKSGDRVDSGTHAPAYSPKPRTPSPGLMQRMQSWEKEASGSGGSGQKGEIGGRKQSVDDLKRLYEERATTVAGLARTKSNSSQRSQG